LRTKNDNAPYVAIGFRSLKKMEHTVMYGYTKDVSEYQTTITKQKVSL